MQAKRSRGRGISLLMDVPSQWRDKGDRLGYADGYTLGHDITHRSSTCIICCLGEKD